MAQRDLKLVQQPKECRVGVRSKELTTRLDLNGPTLVLYRDRVGMPAKPRLLLELRAVFLPRSVMSSGLR